MPGECRISPRMAGGVGGRGEPGGVGRCQGTKGRGAGQGHRILRGVRGSSLRDPGGKKSRVDGLGPRLPGKAQSASAGHACPWGLGLSRDMAVLLQPWEGTGRAAFCLQVGPPTPTLARPRPEHSPPAPPNHGASSHGAGTQGASAGPAVWHGLVAWHRAPQAPCIPLRGRRRMAQGLAPHRQARARRAARQGGSHKLHSLCLPPHLGRGRPGWGWTPRPRPRSCVRTIPSLSALASCPRKAAVSVLMVLQLKGGSVRHPELSL